MSNPAFIVDGYTELKIVQRICPGSPIKRIDCNGKDVTINAIAKKIASHIRLLGNKYYPIVILVDKERRNIGFEDMAAAIRNALEEQGITDQDLRIGVADRMLENWIIADWQTLGGPPNAKPSSTDVCHGESHIKKLKKTYDKTTDGVEFFMAARQEEIYRNSPSYKYFMDQLADLKCSYMDFIKS